MVCSKCEKKLTKVACPDPWKKGYADSGSSSRKINENKLLTKRQRWVPYGSSSKCRTCKAPLHQEALYCHGCAYKKGICAMCGKQVLDVSKYRQSND